MAINLPTGLISHTRKVQSLYKKSIRLLESWYDRREVFRYHAVLMRDRFEQNRCVQDQRIAKELIFKGEEELFHKAHYHPRKWLNNSVYTIDLKQPPGGGENYRPYINIVMTAGKSSRLPESPGGVAYGREVTPPDWVVDYWHPLEKAQYPEYFARREQRKKEYAKMWEKKYGKSSYTATHH